MSVQSNRQQPITLPGSLDEIQTFTLEDAALYRSQSVEFDLTKVLSQIYRLLLPCLSKAKISLSIKTLPDTKTTIFSDPNVIAIILAQILIRLTKTFNHAKINISLAQFNDDLVLSIGSDTIENIDSLLPDLAIANKYCEQAGFTLTAEQTPNQGNVLKLTIVLTPSDSEDNTKDRENPLRILIVEDNDVNATVLGHFLQAYEADIHRVCNGKEAVDYIDDHTVDFIMMDINMPVMNGHEACQIIRQNDTINQPVIIAVTANTTQQSQDKCVQSGMDEFIAKPFTTQALYEVMSKFL